MVHLVSALNHLFTGGGFGKVAQCLSGVGGCLSHFLLFVDLWYLKHGQHVTLVYVVAFLDTKFGDASRQLASHAILANFDLSLNDFLCAVKCEITDDGYQYDDAYEAEDSQ